MTGTTVLLVSLAAAAAGFFIAIALRGRRPRPMTPEVAAALEGHGARLDRLADALGRRGIDDDALRRGLEETQRTLDRLRARSEERRAAEETAWDALRRLETMLLGGSERGRAGENVLQEALGCLPAGMVERDYGVNGKRVEFALILPDGRRMPVDSKWAAAREVEALADEADPPQRAALERRLEDEVTRRAREVASYLEPSLTTPFAVACVPDAAFAACRKAHAEAFRRGVVIVSYSAALPVLLSLYALSSRFGGGGDIEACLVELEGLLAAMGSTLENKVARAATMLQNAADEWRTHLGKAQGSIARGRGVAGSGEAPLRALP